MSNETTIVFQNVPITCVIEECGEAWLRVSDVAKALKITDVDQYDRLQEHEYTKYFIDIVNVQIFSNTLNPYSKFINVSGLALFLINCNLLHKSAFAEWLFGTFERQREYLKSTQPDKFSEYSESISSPDTETTNIDTSSASGGDSIGEKSKRKTVRRNYRFAPY